jgi:hypothetical protein
MKQQERSLQVHQSLEHWRWPSLIRHLSPHQLPEPLATSHSLSLMDRVNHKASTPPNGCELPVLGPQAQVSGRGSRPQSQSRDPASSLPLASAPESPVRSSELLGGSPVQSQHIGNTLVSRHRLHPAGQVHLLAADSHLRHNITDLHNPPAACCSQRSACAARGSFPRG